MIVRFRRSRGDERQQMKWMTFAAVFLAAGVIVPDLVGIKDAGDVFFAVSISMLPIALGIAMLKYRLYDIDRLINRTLVYAALTIVLGAAYVGLVLAGQALFSSVAGGSNLAIATSTLVVAALFLPVRSRVQRVRRPALLPPSLRRAADARGLRRAPPRAGRAGDAERGPRSRRAGDDPAGARVALAPERAMSRPPPDLPHALTGRGRDLGRPLCLLRRARRRRELRPGLHERRRRPRRCSIIVPFVAVGVVVTWKRPANLVGWALLLAGLGILLEGVLRTYAELALLAKPEAGLPAGGAAAAIALGAWTALMGGVFLLLVVFPSGTLSSPGMRRFAVLVLLDFAAIWFIIATSSDARATARGVRQPARADDERSLRRRPRDPVGRRVPRLDRRRRGHRRAPLPPLPG